MPNNNNKLKTIISVIIILMTLSTYCQTGTTGASTVQYTYDASGNRIERKLIIMTKTSGLPSEQNEEEEETLTPLQDELTPLSIQIYPNPTTGIIKINLQGIEDPHKVKIELYTLSGILLQGIEQACTTEQIDITGATSGMYLLQITYRAQTTLWKIIKK